MKQEIDINAVEQIPSEYPPEFISFVQENKLKPPSIKTGNGKALAIMLYNTNYYFTRKSVNDFVVKFGIETKDSIQLFNKHEQWGIKTSTERGKYYITQPYQITNKHKMRKNFKFDGTEQQKNQEIEKIKMTIQADYIQAPNELWQLGHKNPDSTDNTMCNLVLQPPIQAKYRDNYIFIDTLTKVPTPKTFKNLHEKNNLPYTNEQLIELRDYLNSLNL